MNSYITEYDPGVLKEELKLEYVLSSKQREGLCGIGEKDVLVIAHIYYEHLIEQCVDYLLRIPSEMEKCITTSSDEKKRKINQICLEKKLKCFQIRVVKNRGREISALLVGCKDLIAQYSYIGFLHDKATSGNVGAAKVGNTFMYIMWENMLKSAEYIYNVLQLLESHSNLGVVVPPQPYHGQYFGNYGNEWTGCYEITQELARKLCINCKMSKEFPPFTIGTAFWCKKQALEALWKYDWQYEEFQTEPLPLDNSLNHAIERIFAYVAQHEGYVTGIVMNEDFASIQLSNYSYILKGLLRKRGK